jgi:alpha-L-fucosidase
MRRRSLIKGMAACIATSGVRSPLQAASPSKGPFQSNWASLTQGYRTPDWFRDAKFGIWAHWGAQAFSEAGDWYARDLYIQGSATAKHHLKHYGHPSETGFLDIIGQWKAERWDPQRLLALYKQAGARYFVALANHHDNFDNYASSHHGWNSTRVGPKKDLIAGWAKAARDNGLRFGVSSHASHAWHWYQPAYGYDLEGPQRGKRYDAFWRTKADGRGTWWEGLDPQELYTGRYPGLAMPDGIGSIAEANVWHERTDRQWDESAPRHNPAFTRQWLARCRELIDVYRPDFLYLNDHQLPLGQAGLDITAHFYNASMQWHGGELEAVVTAKRLQPIERTGIVEDIERGGRSTIDDYPWETGTCLGGWFYDRDLYDKGAYKNARTVIHMLADTVSKNGNLLLSVPLRPDGTIDDKLEAIVTEIGRWIGKYGDAIYGSRPWRLHREGPHDDSSGMMQEKNESSGDARDIRYTRKGDTLHAILLGWPDDGIARLTLLGADNPVAHGEIARVTLAGDATPLAFERRSDALVVTLPDAARDPIGVAVAIDGRGIAAT